MTCLFAIFINMALLLQEMLHRTIDVTITANLATQITQIIHLRIKGKVLANFLTFLGQNSWPGWLYWIPGLGYHKVEIKIFG